MTGLAEHDGFALDLDGVVWLSKEPIPGAPEAVATIRERASTVFLTNDPRSTREEVAANLERTAVPTSLDDIVTSASATAETLAAERPGMASALVLTGRASAADLDADPPVRPDFVFDDLAALAAVLNG